MAKPRLKGTALAKRRQEVAQMNLAGMTLAQIGERLGVNAATVCRDLAWVAAKSGERPPCRTTTRPAPSNWRG